MLRRLAITAVFVSLLSIQVGCGDSTSSAKDDTPPLTENGEPNDGSAARTDMVYAQDWQDIYMSANSAKTNIDSAAHYTTTRNACGLDGWGVMELKDWNEIATAVNSAVAAPVAAQQCFQPTETWPNMDGFVEVRLPYGQKRNLLETLNGQVCTTISDLAAAQKLYASMNKLVLAADCAQCTTGWAPARCTNPGGAAH